MKSELYRGIKISFKQVTDVDGNKAVQYFIAGNWMGIVSTKQEAMTRAKRRVNKLLTEGH